MAPGQSETRQRCSGNDHINTSVVPGTISGSAVNSYVGTRIKARKKQLGLSQAQLGQMLGVSFQQIQKYEAGQNQISVARLHQFVSALRVPLPFFFEGLRGDVCVVSEGEQVGHAEAGDADIVALVATWYRGLSPAIRDHICGLLAATGSGGR